ncbi:MAG TPA: hypothetical protein VGZ48_06725 [Candidatus Acidoferrales bacterium]|jgi:photosystem II stability/assembly factor-like uncharacterized protein|nr:hypothetical protein [Candidatus Acidoferrales bacterium]
MNTARRIISTRNLIWAGSLALAFAALLLAPWRGAARPPQSPAGRDPSLYSGMKWRMIGPFRAGRAVAVTGVPGQPSHFFFGAVGGGVWESTTAGENWTPIFDDEAVQSIGAIGVAPSDPKIIYVGSGEADMRSQISYGNGMYKSADGGKTWSHIGLEDTRQIGRVIVDPNNPNIVFVAALGHAYGPNPDRGVFRSTDGGATWEKVLYKNDNVGAIDLAFDPKNSKIIYASLWATRRPPWTIYPPSIGPGGGLYKSTDGGNTWLQMSGGFPADGNGRIGVAVAPSDAKRVYAIVDNTDPKKGGLYRSDDSGKSWQLMGVDPNTHNTDQRIWGRGWYFCNVVVDPKNPDKLYISNTSVYRSDDGGKTFIPIKGAPGGDDYHQLWIYPDDGNRMILSSDQGVVVSVDGGLVWSSWYNQPTAQIYHIVSDNQDPYWVYGAQQDSGAVKAATRTVHGSISYMWDWAPICAGGESGYVAVDPSDSNIIYGGTVSTCDQRTNAGHNVSPMLGSGELGPFRHTWTLPLVFSQATGHALYFSNQYLWKSADRGANWTRISGDMTRENPGVPANLDAATAADGYGAPRPGVIYTIAPSPLAADTIWIGTDDGLIHVTHDGGKTWKNVTPTDMTAWSKVSLVEASHSDPNGAYASVDRHRLEDYKPYIYRTHDGGKTWKMITNGIPDGSYVNAVKEDTVRKGLLFAGTELGVYVSFDDGENWQSLQQNLPHSSARDFTIHGDDLIVATHGRGFWVLDNITALRQIAAMNDAPDAIVFKTQTALRRRTGGNDGTPLPYGSAETDNPPNGAIIDYYLKSAATGPVTLEILDSAGKTVRSYSSPEAGAAGGGGGGRRGGGGRGGGANIPAYWNRPPETLSSAAGMHRWVWDVHYAATPGAGGGGRGGGGGGGGGGIWALPGTYSVKLTANGKSVTAPLTVKMDPHVKATPADLQRQFAVAQEVAAAQVKVAQVRGEVTSVHMQIALLRPQAAGNAALAAALDALDAKTAEIGGVTQAGSPQSSGVTGPSNDVSSLMFAAGELGQVSGAVEGVDAPPSMQVMNAFASAQKLAAAATAKWSAVKAKDLAAVNAQLKAAGLKEISMENAAPVAGRGRRGQ